MGEPIRSRLLDFVEDEPPARAAADQPSGPEPEPRRSRLMDFVEAEPPARSADDQRPGPKPGVPPYHTAVFVPAHPQYIEARNAAGLPVRVPYIAYELFEHPAGDTVAFAFTTLEKLVEALGEAQPWVGASIGPLAEAVAEQGVSVLLDPRVAPGHHNWQPADLAAYAEEMR